MMNEKAELALLKELDRQIVKSIKTDKQAELEKNIHILTKRLRKLEKRFNKLEALTVDTLFHLTFNRKNKENGDVLGK